MTKLDILNNTINAQELAIFADHLELKLTKLGSLNLLGIAIRIAPKNESVQVLDQALSDLSVGQPMPFFLRAADDAAWWAGIASLGERKHYAAAILQTFSQAERAAFLGYAERIAA